MLNAENHHRRSIRFAGYDYAAQGAYFVTLCATDKKPVFGKIQDNVMHPNAYGAIARDCWLAMPEHFSFVLLDEFVLMPNHFHAILMFESSFRDSVAADQPTSTIYPRTLGALLRSFKSAVTRQTNLYRQSRGLHQVRVWQRNYFERIIRDERELDQIRRYIAENPDRWHTDENNPRNKL